MLNLNMDDFELDEDIESSSSETTPNVKPEIVQESTLQETSMELNIDDFELDELEESNEPVLTDKRTTESIDAPIPGSGEQITTGSDSTSLGRELKSMVAPEPMRIAGTAAARPILGIASVSEDIANIFGADTNVIKTLMQENEAEIAEYNKNNPDQPINASTIGDLASNFALGLVGKSATAVAGIEGAIEFFKSLGKDEDYSEAAQKGAIGAIVAGTTYKAVDYVLDSSAFKGLSHKMRNVLENKDDAQLQEYLDMLKMAKDKDIKIFDAMLEGDLSTIKSSNLFAKDQIANIANQFEKSELTAINSIIKQEVKSFKELGEKFADKSKALRETFRAEEKTLHDSAAKLGGDNTYDIRPLQEKVVNMLREEGTEQTVINAIKRELFHLEKTMLPKEKAVRKSYESARKAVTSLTSKLSKADPKSKGRYTMLLNRAKANRDRLKEEVDSFQDISWLSTKQLMNTVKRINSDIFTKGGQSWGASDAAAKRMAGMARNEVKKYIEQVNKNNPKFLETYKAANAKSADRFSLFGSGDKGTKDFGELAHALQTGDTEQLARNIVGSQSKFKLSMINDVLGKELSDDFVAKYVKESLELTPGKTVRGDELFQIDMANTDRLATRLTNLVGDKDNYDFIAANYGEQAAKDLLSLQKISNGLKTEIGAMKDRVSELDKGVLNYVGEKGLIVGTMKIVKDGTLNIINKMLKREPYMKTKEVEKTIKALEKHLSSNSKIPFIQKLKNIGTTIGFGAAATTSAEATEVDYNLEAGDGAYNVANKFNLSKDDAQAAIDKTKGHEGDKISVNSQGYPVDGMAMPDNVKAQESLGNEDTILTPHKPSKESGWTIGYGYDKLDKKASEVYKDFKAAGIDKSTASKFLQNKKFNITQEQAEALADISWVKSYEKGIRIGLKLNEMPTEDRSKVISLLYRGDIVKGGKGYRGKLYNLSKDGNIEGINELINSKEVPEALSNRWNKGRD